VESLFHTCGGIVERKRSEEKEVNHDFKFLIDHFLWDFRRGKRNFGEETTISQNFLRFFINLYNPPDNHNHYLSTQ
jgi:hypothetical protein